MTDSALRELADDPSSRKRFFKMLGGAGAVSAATVLIAACGDDKKSATTAGAAASASSSDADNASDLKIVNYALTLEYLEATFYQEVLDSGVIKDKKIGDLAKALADTERQHVDALIATAKSLTESDCREDHHREEQRIPAPGRGSAREPPIRSSPT